MKQQRLFRLLVDGKVAVSDVPENELASLLRKYGVMHEPTLHQLKEGHTRRLLGQMLQVQQNITGQQEASPEQPMPAAAAAVVPEGTKINKPEIPEQRPYNPNTNLVAEKLQADWSKGGDKANIAQVAEEHYPPVQKQASLGPYEAPVQELNGRAKKLRKGTQLYGAAGLVLAFIGVIFLFVGIAYEPYAGIDQILVPEVIAKAFPSTDTGGMFEASSAIAAAFDISGIFGSTVFRFISALAMVAGIAMAVLNGRLSMMVPGVMMGAMPFIFSTVFESVSFEDRPANSSPSHFQAAIDSKNLASLQSILVVREDLDEVARAYVLAQASVGSDVVSKWVGETAKNLRDGNNSFPVPGYVAYAIEAAAVGPDSPDLSDEANGYRQGALADEIKWKRNSFWTLLLAGILGVVATGHEALAQIIFRRVRRIGELLTPQR